jgi:actin-related protein 6
LIDWDLEKEIWELVFRNMQASTKDCEILLTEPPMNPASVRRLQSEVLFEYYKFKGASFQTGSKSFVLFLSNNLAACLAMYNYKWEGRDPSNSISPPSSQPCSIVLDTGYSFSHTIPFFDNFPINYAIKRQEHLKFVLLF